MSDLPSTSERERRLERVLADYLHAVEAGRKPDRAALLGLHADLAAELSSFFRNRDAIERIAEPIKQQAPALPETLGVSGASDLVVGSTLRYFGDYELLEEIARGGMGVVFKARQVSLNRVVALKMILKGELATAADVQRFHAEAEAAASLDHPNIVPIYEVGEHEGRQYFAMKLVEGGSLAGHIAEYRDRPHAAVALLATVARAVHHAHQRGILHRDLKPANILVASSETASEYVPLVSDFGLAKRLQKDAGPSQSGAIVGTPSYMAPEQATGQKGLSTAADVYSLGAILYELLTGQPPFRADTPLETLFQVVERQPVKPRVLNTHIDRDMETITMKCLEKEASRRYGTVEALAEDLDRFLAGQPIHARPTTPTERLAKWARRQPVLASALATAATAAVALIVLAGFLWRSAALRAEAVQSLGEAEAKRAKANELADEQRSIADEQARLAKRQKALADKIEAEVSGLRSQADTARDQLQAARIEAGRTLYAADMQLAHVAWQTDNVAGTRDLLERYRKPSGDDPRGFEWHYLQRRLHGARLEWSIDPQATGDILVTGLAISPDRKTAATAHRDGKVKLWSLGDGKLLKTIEAAKESGDVYLIGLAFADEGRKVVAALQSPRGAQDLTKVMEAMQRKDKLDLRLLTSGFIHFRTWNVADDLPSVRSSFDPARVPSPLSPVFGGGFFVQHEGEAMLVLGMAHSADGKFLALSGPVFEAQGPGEVGRGKLIVWDVVKAKVHAVQTAPIVISAVAFSPDGKQLAVGSTEGSVAVGGPDLAGSPRPCAGHRGHVYSLRFSADGKRLFSSSADGYVIAWVVPAGKEIARLRGHTAPVLQVELAADGQTLVSGSQDGAVKVWDLGRTIDPLVIRGDENTVEALTFADDGRNMIAVDGLNLKTWRATDGKLLHESQVTGKDISAVRISQSGKRLAWRDDRTLVVRDLTMGKDTRLPWKDHFAHALALSADDKLLAAGTHQAGSGSLAIWNIADGKEVASREQVNGLQTLTFSSDNKLLLAADWDGVLVWDWQAGKSRRILSDDARKMPTVLACSSDNKWVAGAAGAVVRIWDLERNALKAEFSGAGQEITHLAFSPHGRRLATAGTTTLSQQGVLKLWDTTNGREVFSAPLPPTTITALAFSRDGNRFAAATRTTVLFVVDPNLNSRKGPSEIHVWDATPIDGKRP